MCPEASPTGSAGLTAGLAAGLATAGGVFSVEGASRDFTAVSPLAAGIPAAASVDC